MTTTVRHVARRATTHAAPGEPDWNSALCAQTDPELFYADGMGGAVHYRTVDAKKVCTRCPLQTACLAWALDTEQSYGVWGGATEDERRLMRRQGASGASSDGEAKTQRCLDRQVWIEEQVRAGMGQRELAKRLGVSRATLCRAIARFEQERAAGAAAEEVQAA
jgi:WhiB family redox-sensing transcriptional regulator